jgi:hypothetical protein
MTKAQLKNALETHKQRTQAENAGRILVPGYPYSHNPYLPHEPVADCYAGCVR